ncbi:outer membrane beta-barrel protein [[Flexibacter] sp. ATCC 35208]|uniref:outer membrane beta-barrel protein n=1 Tax=[Flexibacter] sp. ATCC 35208 TaxID=1936242 RepID=UPI00117D3F2C
MDGGFKKSLLQGKLDLKVSFSDLFHTNRTFRKSLSKLVENERRNASDSRWIAFTFQYQMGGKLSAGKVRSSEELRRF